MNLLYLLIGIIILSIIWIVPTTILSFLIKNIIKKKLSKGWCVFISFIIFWVNIFIETAIIGVHQPGMIDMIIRLACLSIVFRVLYDKTIPSILDSEKEILQKREVQNSKDE